LAQLPGLVFSAWTTPRTWVTDELVTASMLNTHIRDNLNALKTPPHNSYSTTGNYSTTSTSWVDVDSGNMSLTVVSAGGPLIICAEMTICVDASDYTGTVYFDLDVNGNRIEQERILTKKAGAAYDRVPVSLVWRVLVDAGENEIALQWKIALTATTAYIFGIDFWVAEVS
jgi:hypothetical protein